MEKIDQIVEPLCKIVGEWKGYLWRCQLTTLQNATIGDNHYALLHILGRNHKRVNPESNDVISMLILHENLKKVDIPKVIKLVLKKNIADQEANIAKAQQLNEMLEKIQTIVNKHLDETRQQLGI